MDSSGINDDRPAAENTPSFGYLLRRLRKARNFIGRRAGCTANTIHKIEVDLRRPSPALASRRADGIYFAALAGMSSTAQLTSALAGTLGIALEPGPRTQRRQLLDYLRNKRLLLILDNYEQAGEDLQLLLEIVEMAPGVALVITCRERLLLHVEQLMALAGLDLPPRDDHPDVVSYSAVQLFVRTATRSSSTTTSRTATRSTNCSVSTPPSSSAA
ncbi:MAG: hypothetical protein WCI67_11215, partial [Chloroflexales bacterium]